MAREKKDKEAMSDLDAYKHISSMFGDSVFHPEEIEEVSTFTSRSPSLDRALGVGGWARGRIYQVAGRPSSGKTFMSLVAMAEWQSLDPENCCCFIDAEYTYDPRWAKKLGIDNDRVFLVKTNEAQKILEGLVGTPKKNKITGEVKQIPGLLDMVKNGQSITHSVNGRLVTLNLSKMGVIVLDSIAAMAAPSELESEVGKNHMAPLSRFLTTELRKLTPAVAWSNVCFIAINHVKEKIGVMFGNPDTTPGGAAFKHACSVMLMVSPINGADNMMTDDHDERFGHKIKIKVEKNKMSPPFKIAEFFIAFNSGVAKVDEQLLELGLLYGTIKKLNNVTYTILGETISSKANVMAYIKDNMSKIEKDIRSKYLSGFEIVLDDEGKEEEFPKDPFDVNTEE